MVRVIGLLLAVAVVTGGCAGGPFSKGGASNVPSDGPVVSDSTTSAPPLLPEPGLRSAIDRRFPDVPLPQGVSPDLERSYVYESSLLQVGRLVYTTRAKLTELAEFYARECPNDGWTLDTVLQANGYELNYKKPGKRLVISIRNMGIRKGRMLTLNLTPEE